MAGADKRNEFPCRDLAAVEQGAVGRHWVRQRTFLRCSSSATCLAAASSSAAIRASSCRCISSSASASAKSINSGTDQRRLPSCEAEQTSGCRTTYDTTHSMRGASRQTSADSVGTDPIYVARNDVERRRPCTPLLRQYGAVAQPHHCVRRLPPLCYTSCDVAPFAKDLRMHTDDPG